MSLIDKAIHRELVGDGIALEEAVANKKSSGWAVRQRQAQRNDLGHFCYGCGQPLRDLNEEVTVWTGAAIYRRFHPACAASYVLRAEPAPAERTRDRVRDDVVEGYADAWRAPRASVRPVEAARQWLLSEDQRAWGSLRGDLFTTVTVNENGKKKAVPGLSYEQLRILQTKHRWQPEFAGANEGQEPLECAVCFCAPDASSCCIRLPCAPQHVFHLSCVLPWLKKAGSMGATQRESIHEHSMKFHAWDGARRDARLAEALREARELQEELQLEGADLAQLRIEADLALKEKQRWEQQLEVSRSCIQKLEARLLQIRRVRSEGNLQAQEADRRLYAQMEELLRQRERLLQERTALEQQAEEHSREVQALSLALKKFLPATQNGKAPSDWLLKQELTMCQHEVQAYQQQQDAASAGLFEARTEQKAALLEFEQCRRLLAGTAEQQELCSIEALKLRDETREHAEEAAAAKLEEAAVKEEAAAKKQLHSERSAALRKLQVAKAELLRQVRELEAAASRARGDLTAEKAARKAYGAELEVRCGRLRAELEEHAALRCEGTAARAVQEAENAQLEASAARLALQLEADEEARAQMEAKLLSSMRLAEHQQYELRAQELMGQNLAEEVAEGQRMEQALQRELAHERAMAKEASSEATALLEQRQRKALEAEEALKQCDAALLASQGAEEELRQREKQLQQSARSSELMHRTLVQRLSTVHDQVRVAEDAHAAALEELRGERREQSRWLLGDAITSASCLRCKLKDSEMLWQI
ncbi:APT1 [Symbiodinium natans]|uniref:APT1 protein n=1 Tax=Symbiodinium natans TaxID=878477 RepID=A0A812UZU7_9DINO|nr:APT1 [Symbiodinium natans]